MTRALTARRRSGRTNAPGTVTNLFWMVREFGFYKFYRENRKPRLRTITSTWDQSTWKTFGDNYTTQLCIGQVHRMYPGLSRMRSLADAKLVRITIQDVK